MNASARILVATDQASDADLVRRLLRDEFEQVAGSTSPEHAVRDFEQHRPEVLVLAFNSLEKAESYYLGLYRLGTLIHTLPHRTVILCRKDELLRVYALCKREYFDDYVLFWPVPHDGPRLPMAVHHALRLLTLGGPAVATAARFARSVEALAAAAPPAAVPPAASTVPLTTLSMAPPAPLPADTFSDIAPAIPEPAARLRPLLLVVEDDEYQHKLLGALLRDAAVELVFARSGTAALAALQLRCPALILMDIGLPDIDGIEAMRGIKSVERFANVPVLMITGHGDKEVVMRSMQAGAAGFVVKPFSRETLLEKIAACLPPAQPA